MQLKMVLTMGDLIAALQMWVPSPTGGSTQGVTHQMNATVNPVIDTADQTQLITILLNS